MPNTRYEIRCAINRTGLLYCTEKNIECLNLTSYLKTAPKGKVPLLADDMMLADLLGLKKRTLYWISNPYIQRESKSNKNGSSVYSFYKVAKIFKRMGKDGSKKYRYLQIPLNELKYIQDQIFKKIVKYIEFPEYVVGFIAGKSIVDAAKVHCDKKIVLSIDLERFFESVTQKQIETALMLELNYPKEVSKIISEIATFRHWLPQGASTSPGLANLVGLHYFDREVKLLADEYKFAYTRYADDLTFSTNEDYKIESVEKSLVLNDKGEEEEILIPRSEVDTFYKKLRKILNTSKFRINERKTKTYRDSRRKYVLGIVVNKRPNIMKKKYNIFKSIVHNLKYYSVKHEAEKTDRTEEEFLAWLKGNLNFLKQVNPEKGVRLLNELALVLKSKPGYSGENLVQISFTENVKL